MNMKQKCLLLSYLILLSALITACSGRVNKETESQVTPESQATTDPQAVAADSNLVNTSTSDMLDAVMAVYDEDPALRHMSNEEIQIRYSLNMEAIEEMAGAVLFAGDYPDQMIIVKAAAGRAHQVEAKFNATREYLQNGALQYPDHISLITVARVVRQGDYVGFFLIGAVNQNTLGSKEDQIIFAEADTERAVAVFNSYFQ